MLIVKISNDYAFGTHIVGSFSFNFLDVGILSKGIYIIVLIWDIVRCLHFWVWQVGVESELERNLSKFSLRNILRFHIFITSACSVFEQSVCLLLKLLNGYVLILILIEVRFGCNLAIILDTS